MVQETFVKTKLQKTQIPFIFLVATQIDVDPTKAEFMTTMASAQDWADEHEVKLKKVSAADNRGVEDLLTTSLQTVRAKQSLWVVDVATKSTSVLSDASYC